MNLKEKLSHFSFGFISPFELISIGFPATEVDILVDILPEPEPGIISTDMIKHLPEIPEADIYTPVTNNGHSRILNQRQKRKLKRQQPHGRI